jgi:NadR type nicotinamide-nucleotide adenylyltransferase
MQNDSLRIALIGPESTGKTTLCDALAKKYNTCWVPEYARDYILSLKRQYTKEDILLCAEMQIKSEEELLKKANKLLFSDTELIILKVWLLDLYYEYPDWIDKKIDERKYDLYLLTSPDIPFIPDKVRENPTRREYFFNWYKKELDERKLNYIVISGDYEFRFAKAIESIEFLLNEKRLKH